MKYNKKVILIIVTILLTAILAVTFTSCLKIGLKEDKVKSRIVENGGTCNIQRSNPITGDPSDSHSIETVYLAKFTMDNVEQTAYVFYCGDDDSAAWVKEQSDAYLTKMREEQTILEKQIADGEKFIELETVIDYKHWISYQYDRCIICGYSKVVSIIRTY